MAASPLLFRRRASLNAGTLSPSPLSMTAFPASISNTAQQARIATATSASTVPGSGNAPVAVVEAPSTLCSLTLLSGRIADWNCLVCLLYLRVGCMCALGVLGANCLGERLNSPCETRTLRHREIKTVSSLDGRRPSHSRRAQGAL